MQKIEQSSAGSGRSIQELRERIRHSAAHLMADAVTRLFPEAKLGIGPPTQDGFYYDLEVSRPFTPEDLERITGIMEETIARDLPFVLHEHGRDEIKQLCHDQPYKLELIDEIPDDETLTTYTHDGFTDLCQGPHVASTGKIPAFKLLSVAGAYWRGSESRPMLQRIYGTAFENRKALRQHLNRLAEAEKRDHRRLGKELELFLFDPLAPASPFFLPKGAEIYTLLVDYVRGLYKRYGYQEVITPEIFSTDLWKRSGHYENYLENMYIIDVGEREYGVKPMNCPAHALIYSSQLHSYRDLPLRLADFGRLHRFERSGVTHGLTRVRSFSQDDAHIFCTHEQIAQEVQGFIGMLMESYRAFGFDDPSVELSLRPEKRMGSDETWDRAEAALTDVLAESGLDYEPQPGEGAFYGPKIDFFVPDALGRKWQLGTIQLDFSLPERFDLAIRGGRRLPPSPRSAASGHAGGYRAVHGSAHRALRRCIPPVAGAGSGGCHSHCGPPRRVRRRCGLKAQRSGPAGRSGLQERTDEPEDSGGPAAKDTLYARGGRQGSGGRNRVGAQPRRGEFRTSARL